MVPITVIAHPHRTWIAIHWDQVSRALRTDHSTTPPAVVTSAELLEGEVDGGTLEGEGRGETLEGEGRGEALEGEEGGGTTKL